ncbi:hypothetical protein [Microvirga yunnanensis]|uniref:hypothetical protein n=1 Tax=Microvirga yunnanensis TaxID=2953740 RepID=UPI00359FB5BA
MSDRLKKSARIVVLDRDTLPEDITLRAFSFPHELVAFGRTPHVAWASHEAVQGLADQRVDKIEAFERGQPRNMVAA